MNEAEDFCTRKIKESESRMAELLSQIDSLKFIKATEPSQQKDVESGPKLRLLAEQVRKLETEVIVRAQEVKEAEAQM